MKLKKGDKVLVIYGKDRGREGTVERVLVKKGQVVVGGVNLYKKHLKPVRGREKGGIVEIAKPLDAAKVMVLCSKCAKPVRVGYMITGGKKKRVCRKCRADLSVK